MCVRILKSIPCLLVHLGEKKTNSWCLIPWIFPDLQELIFWRESEISSHFPKIFLGKNYITLRSSCRDGYRTIFMFQKIIWRLFHFLIPKTSLCLYFLVLESFSLLWWFEDSRTSDLGLPKFLGTIKKFATGSDNLQITQNTVVWILMVWTDKISEKTIL